MSSFPHVVKVRQRFIGEQPGELTIEVDDVIQVEQQIDKFWLYGNCRGQYGQFPWRNIIEIDSQINNLKPNESLFAAHRNFYPQKSNELPFKRGDLLIGFNYLGNDLWFGCHLSNRDLMGEFSMDFVWQLNTDLLPKSDLNSNGFYVKVKIDMKAQLNNEMDLFKDEVLKANEYDKMFFTGESLDGLRKGIFPKSFVTVIEDFQGQQHQQQNYQDQYQHQQQEYQEQQQHYHDQQYHQQEFYDQNNINLQSFEAGLNNNSNEYDTFDVDPPSYSNAISISDLNYNNEIHSNEIQSYGRTLYEFKAEYPNELSFKHGQIVHLIKYIDDDWMQGEINGKIGIFPKNFIEIIVDCEPLHTASIMTTPQEEIPHEETPMIYPSDTYARTTYDFNGEQEGDLTVRKGELITLIKKIGHWVEAVNDNGTIGFVPFDYIEKIDDVYQNINQLNQESQINNNRDVNSAVDFDPLTSQQEHDSTNQPVIIVSSESQKKAPSRPAPPAPKDKSPHRAPPPVPKHAKRLSMKKGPEKGSNSSVETSSFSRQESTRSSSSCTSNSSSSSTNSSLKATEGQGPKNPHQIEIERREAAKRSKQLECVIIELLQTERDYLNVLSRFYELLMQDEDGALRVGLDLSLIIGNLPQVIDVSEQLVRLLAENMLQQQIGKCFLQLESEFRSAYGNYCRQHDEQQQLFKQKYESSKDVQNYVGSKVEQLREEMNFFDIPAILIKPVQRILKYPLLLNEMIKNMDNQHQDKQNLLKAINLITDLATEINESKRRQDLLSKYKSGTLQASTSQDSRYRLTLKTVKKKSSRLGFRISSTFGLSSTTKDPEFEGQMIRFKRIDKMIKIFLKDLEYFIKSFEDFTKSGFSLSELISNYYDDKRNQLEVDQFRQVHHKIVTDYFSEFKMTLDQQIVEVLKKLVMKFDGPMKLIQKRNDKLLDYDSCLNKMDQFKGDAHQNKVKLFQEQLSLAKHTYEALNQQLIDDLPKLCQISMLIFNDSVKLFFKIRKKFVGNVARHYLDLVDLPLLFGFKASGSSQDIIEAFNIKHNLIVTEISKQISIVMPTLGHHLKSFSGSDLSRNKSGRNSRRSLPTAQPLNGAPPKSKVLQSTSQKRFIQSKYHQEQLYQAKSDHQSIDVLDLDIKTGDLVAVIKNKDPLGGTEKWYVDNGIAQGFVPANILVKAYQHTQVQQQGSSIQSSGDNNKSCGDKRLAKQLEAESQHQTPLQSQHQLQTQHQIQRQTGQHQAHHEYKLYSAPLPPLPPRVGAGKTNEHRYDYPPEDKDNPPSYHSTQFHGDTKAASSKVNSQLPAPSVPSFVPPSAASQLPSTSKQININEFDPYATQSISASNQASCNQNLSGEQIDHRYEEIDDIEKEYSKLSHNKDKDGEEVCFAAYPFRGQGAYQLDLQFGQQVIVRYKQDLNGNKEWWYVKDKTSGQEGYVPANYLKKQ